MRTYAEPTRKLGQQLVDRGWITGEQLIRAIQSQRMVGGRLGTCLLEMDVLTEDRLLDALSEQLKVPAARVEQLRGIEDETLQLLSPKVASRCQAVPFFATRNQVNVATLDVHDLGVLDELAFATNKKIVPHIANEVRVFEALEKYYGFELPKRYGHLLDRLNRSRYMWDESAKILFGKYDTPAPSDVVWNTAEDTFSALPGSTVAPPPEPQAASPAQPAPVRVSGFDPTPAGGFVPLVRSRDLPIPENLEAVESMLSRAHDSHQVAAVVLAFAARTFDRAALFRIRNGRVGGWKARGEGVDESLFQKFEESLAEPSIFLTLDKGASHHGGPLSDMPVHRQFIKHWGDPPTACLMMPIMLRRRMASVLYGDRRLTSVNGEDVELFQNLAGKAAMAFELCILRRKIHPQ
ncbi:MAG: hypothetical protein AAGM22_33515 [Acidobacteriota bacterium]